LILRGKTLRPVVVREKAPLVGGILRCPYLVEGREKIWGGGVHSILEERCGHTREEEKTLAIRGTSALKNH